VVFCADVDIFPQAPDNLKIIKLPDFHSKQARSTELHEQPACAALDCAPVGVSAIRGSAGIMAAWLAEADPVLFIVDVSAELALLGRICSVPTVKIRMHGDRGDRAHQAAYSACTAILAPFDEQLEQTDWPDEFRSRTFYCGGLIDTRTPIPTREEARHRLGLDPDQRVMVAIAGRGGVGIPLAPMTIAARAFPEALLITVGKVVRYGHETDFANLINAGWVDNTYDYLAAADVVIATPGDTLTHEVARVGRPLICIPEWCYYSEQVCKGEVLERENLGVYSPVWPASFSQWQALVQRARDTAYSQQPQLVDEHAAQRAADFLENHITDLWLDSAPDETDSARIRQAFFSPRSVPLDATTPDEYDDCTAPDESDYVK